MSIKICAPEGAIAARQRVEERSEALHIGLFPNVANHMRDHRGLVTTKSDSIANISAAAGGDSHCRMPYPMSNPPVSGCYRIRGTSRRNG